MAEQTAADDKGGTNNDKDDDSFFCDVCNVTFDLPKAYFAHVYSVSHLQRANAVEKHSPKVRSSPSAKSVPGPISTTDGEPKLGHDMGTEAEKHASSEHQGSTLGSSQLGSQQESTSKTSNVSLPNAFASVPVDASGTPSSSNAPVTDTSLIESIPAQVVRGSTTQVVSSVAVTSSDIPTSTLTSLSDGATVLSSSVCQSQPPSSSIGMPQRMPGDASLASKACAAKPGPLLSTPRIPSLMSMSGVPVPRPQGIGFDPRPAIAPSAASVLSARPQFNPAVSPNQVTPLLRPRPPVPSTFTGFTDAFSAPYLGTTFGPRPTSVLHHSGPLLPTPAPAVRGAPPGVPVHPLMGRPTPGTPAGRPAFSRSWDPNPFSGGEEPQPLGVTVKEYHHGRPAEHKVVPSYDVEDRIVSREQLQFADVKRSVNPSQKLLMGSHVEPLVDGSWVLASRPSVDKGRIYRCQICNMKFDDFLFHELHLAGLRHRKMAKSLTSKGSGSESGAFQSPFEKMDAFEVSSSHDPVFVTGLLDQNPTSTSAKPSASAASSVCYSELEQKLRSHPDPILGVDYLTEYRFLGGRLEYSCDLCDVELKSVAEVADHVTSTLHRLHFLCYNDVETYKSVNEASDPANGVKEAAEKAEKKSGRKSRVRVKLESDDLLSDGQFAWIELKDESIRPVSALPGHRLCTSYSKLKPHEATVTVDSVDSLLQTLALHSCLAANRPPSLARPLRRLDFITALGEFSMTSDKDAEICFQLANFLTVAVINFRRQMLPSLNAIDVSSIAKRLTTLLHNAEAVSQKIITSDPAELDITRSESG